MNGMMPAANTDLPMNGFTKLLYWVGGPDALPRVCLHQTPLKLGRGLGEGGGGV